MLSLQAKSTNKIVAGISIFENGIALAIVDHSKRKPLLKHAHFYGCSGITEQSTLLSRLSKEYKLYDIVCNLVLYSNDYQFHQIDAPDVPKHELSSALRWQIKDLIDFHIDDAVIDKIELPNQNPGSQGKHSLLVVACRQSLVQNYVDLLHAANCNLVSIDIAALAARNIVIHTAPAEDSSVGLLNLWDDRAKISVFLNHDLYINRSSSIGIQSLAFVSEDDPDSQSVLDSLTLELQRTFDYYESHSRQAAISHLYILSNGQSLPHIARLIEARLGIDCSIIEPSDFITSAESMSEAATSNCMMAIGGALRMEY